MQTNILKKVHATRRRLAYDCSIQARKSERAKSNPFFTRRVYSLVINEVCDTYEEAVSHEDR